MSLARLPVRLLLPVVVGLQPLLACECDREVFNPFPDAGKPDAAQPPPPDAGPPPPEFPLKNGDKLDYRGPVQLVYCNNLGSTTCTEQSVVWRPTFTLQEDPRKDDSTGTWKFRGEYWWQVNSVLKNDPAQYATLGQLWWSGFGPWQNAKDDSGQETIDFGTSTMLMEGGTKDTIPFFDMRWWDSSVQALRAKVQEKDSEARVEAQVASGKVEIGYLEPDDPTKLHYVELIYHRLGFLCSIDEFIGPYRQGAPKTKDGLEKIEYKGGTYTAPKLTRASGPKAGVVQPCSCQPGGLDCE